MWFEAWRLIWAEELRRTLRLLAREDDTGAWKFLFRGLNATTEELLGRCRDVVRAQPTAPQDRVEEVVDRRAGLGPCGLGCGDLVGRAERRVAVAGPATPAATLAVGALLETTRGHAKS